MRGRHKDLLNRSGWDITLARPVLIDLGYHTSSPEAMTFTRHFDDILVPRITLDLTVSTHHTTDEHSVREILSRRCWQPLPAHDHPLPVLAGPDALRLARAGENLPAAHRKPLLPATAAAGWARLRHLWPQLPATPVSPGTKR